MNYWQSIFLCAFIFICTMNIINVIREHDFLFICGMIGMPIVGFMFALFSDDLPFYKKVRWLIIK